MYSPLAIKETGEVSKYLTYTERYNARSINIHLNRKCAKTSQIGTACNTVYTL